MVVKGTHVMSLIALLHGDQVEGWNGMMLLWHPCGCTKGTMWAVNPMDALTMPSWTYVDAVLDPIWHDKG